jgi:hypothetical protein
MGSDGVVENAGMEGWSDGVLGKMRNDKIRKKDGLRSGKGRFSSRGLKDVFRKTALTFNWSRLLEFGRVY